MTAQDRVNSNRSLGRSAGRHEHQARDVRPLLILAAMEHPTFSLSVYLDVPVGLHFIDMRLVHAAQL